MGGVNVFLRIKGNGYVLFPPELFLFPECKHSGFTTAISARAPMTDG